MQEVAPERLGLRERQADHRFAEPGVGAQFRARGGAERAEQDILGLNLARLPLGRRKA